MSLLGIYITDSVNKVTRTFLVNLDITRLYLYCYGKTSYPIGHILLKVKDTSRYIYNGNGYRDVWNQKNTFCYEAVLPQDLSKDSYAHRMLGDLDLYLGTNGRMEKTNVEGYILQRMDTAFHLLTREKSRAISEKDGTVSLSIKELMYELNNSRYGVPAFNETKLQSSYLNLPRETLKDISLLQKALIPYGLLLVKGVRETEMFILQEPFIHLKK